MSGLMQNAHVTCVTTFFSYVFVTFYTHSPFLPTSSSGYMYHSWNRSHALITTEKKNCLLSLILEHMIIIIIINRRLHSQFLPEGLICKYCLRKMHFSGRCEGHRWSWIHKHELIWGCRRCCIALRCQEVSRVTLGFCHLKCSFYYNNNSRWW